MEKLTTELVIFIYHLNNIKEKKYSPCKNIHHPNRDVYVFHSRDEYYQYFSDNNVIINNKELLDLAILSNLRNGDIIAMKNVCNYIIDQVNTMIYSDEFSFELLMQKQKVKK